ncbi:MAG: hypothetical protein D6736_03475, partial [Nitrospinota bacterium]
VAAKQWILQGLPLRYLRFLSTTLFRREPREAEQTALLFYLAHFTDTDQEALLFPAGKPKHPRQGEKR